MGLNVKRQVSKETSSHCNRNAQASRGQDQQCFESTRGKDFLEKWFRKSSLEHVENKTEQDSRNANGSRDSTLSRAAQPADSKSDGLAQTPKKHEHDQGTT
eukprot:scaffold5301_cov126-Cylindrotheca_fusiformis.AAC.4